MPAPAVNAAGRRFGAAAPARSDSSAMPIPLLRQHFTLGFILNAFDYQPAGHLHNLPQQHNKHRFMHVFRVKRRSSLTASNNWLCTACRFA